MIEKVVSDNFNVFDIFVRFGPGCILVACFYYCTQNFFSVAFEEFYLKMILYICLSYIVGCLIRSQVHLFSFIFNKIYFGGNPRDIYPYSDRGKYCVLKQSITRGIAGRIRDIIADHFYLHDYLESDSSDIKSECELNRFAFGYMVNYLDINGYINKTNSIKSLSDMCSSVAVTIVLCNIMIIFSGLFHLATGGQAGFHLIPMAVGVVISIVGFVLSCNLYISYTQKRYSVVIEQFVICNEYVRQELHRGL